MRRAHKMRRAPYDAGLIMKKISIHEKHKKEPCVNRGNQNGIVLILSLVFMGILALLGSTAVMLTTTDMKIGDNYKSSAQAFSAAQAGIAEALNRLKGSATESGYAGDTGETATPLWSAYILTSGTWTTADDPEYDSSYANYVPTGTTFTGESIQSNTLQSSVDVNYFVKIRHKREYDAENAGHTTTNTHYTDNDGTMATNTAESPGSIVYYGDDDDTDGILRWVEFTTVGNPNISEARPVEIVRSYGQSGGSLAVIEVELRRVALNIDAKAAVYSKATVTVAGNVDVIGLNAGTGVGTCATDPDVPAIYTYPEDTTVTLSGGALTLDPPDPVSGNMNIPLEDYLAAMGFPEAADEIITGDKGTYGSADESVSCYSNLPDLKLNDVIGYGILAVEGNLEISGHCEWNGLIICTGTLKFSGGANIRGLVMANETVSILGTVEVQYDSCSVEKALMLTSIQVARWRQVYY